MAFDNIIFFETIKLILMSIVLIYASILDIKYMEVTSDIYPLFFAIGMMNVTLQSLIGGAVVFLMLLIIGLFSSLGGADIKTAGLCSFIVSGVYGIIGLAAGLILSLLIMPFVNLKRKQRLFPLIPFLSAGYIFTYFAELFLI